MFLAASTVASASAAATTTIDKFKAVPHKFWLIIGVAVLALVVLVSLAKKAAGMNKIWLSIIVVLVFALVGFNWIYNRSEPKFLTPIVDKIAPWFPSNASAQPLKADDPK